MTEKPWLQDSPPVGKFRYIDLFAAGDTLLDVGCGRGWCGEYARKKGFEVTALDLENDLKFSDLNFVWGSADELPFAERAFDTVLAFDVIEHVKDGERVWSELARVTKKRLILSVPDSDDGLLRKYNLTYKHHTDKSHYREYSVAEVGQRLGRHNFEVIYLERQGPVDPRVIAQFIKPNRWAGFYERMINVLVRAELIKNYRFFADIYAVGEKVE